MDRKGWEDLEKKEGISRKNRRHCEEGFWGLIFFQNIKHSSFGSLKNCSGSLKKKCSGGGFWWVYVNSLNLIYVVIIFLKLEKY